MVVIRFINRAKREEYVTPQPLQERVSERIADIIDELKDANMALRELEEDISYCNQFSVGEEPRVVVHHDVIRKRCRILNTELSTLGRYAARQGAAVAPETAQPNAAPAPAVAVDEKPAVPSCTVPLSPYTGESAPVAKARVLYVDDNSERLEQALERLSGCEVSGVANIGDAWSLWRRKFEFDVVFVDVRADAETEAWVAQVVRAYPGAERRLVFMLEKGMPPPEPYDRLPLRTLTEPVTPAFVEQFLAELKLPPDKRISLTPEGRLQVA